MAERGSAAPHPHPCRREQPKPRRTEREDVGPSVDLVRPPGSLLRRHIRGRSESQAELRSLLSVRDARQAEVEDLHTGRAVLLAREKDVRRLQVSMDDAV